MGIIADILGTGQVVEKGLDLIDSFHTSKEEEIQAKTKAKTDLLQAYAPFKKAQRFLALLFGFTFIGSFLLVLGLTLNSGGSIEDIQKVLSEFYIGEIMLTIILFYFGGGAFEGAITRLRGKGA